MRYSVNINRNIEDLAHCIQWINENINNIWSWRVSINAGGIDYGIYFNFDIENKEFEICNQPRYNESFGLSEIIEKINRYYNEE